MNNLNSLDKAFNNIDWDFSNLSNEGLNSFHWYPATFVSAIPGSIIPLLTEENETILDTFCGTSVTGYEAIRLGRKYIGIDNNPIAILISKSKLIFPDKGLLFEVFQDYFNDSFKPKNLTKKHPNEELLMRWYHPDTYYELNNLLNIISKIENPIIKIPALSIFSSILKKTCSQTKHWGWVCDNVIPKPEEILYKNAKDIFHKSLLAYCKSVEESLKNVENRGIDISRIELRNMSELFCSDTNKTLSTLESNSIDLIITSPPYYGVADYVKAQRLSFLWFEKSITEVEGYSFEDFENLRKREMGARSKRYSQSSHTEFMNYMREYILLCQDKLKQGRFLVLIVGDSKSRDQTIDFVDEFAINNGFTKEFEFFRLIRESRRRLMAKVKNEQIKVYKKI